MSSDRDDKDWDKAFEELISSDLSDVEGFNEPGQADMKDLERIDNSAMRSADQPGPTSDEFKANHRCIAVILTPVANDEDLAALFSLNDIDATIISTSMGAIVYEEYPADDRDEFEELLGDDRPVPKAAEELAKTVSSIMSYLGVVLCVSWLRDTPFDDTELVGQVVAKRYINRKFDTNLPAGQLVSVLDDRVEDLLLGLMTPEQFNDGVRTKQMGKMQALKRLRHIFSQHTDDEEDR